MTTHENGHRQFRSLAVFCGANRGIRPIYAEAAAAMGRLLAEHGIRVVFGGGQVGLMGVVADAALAAGGEVIGVIPHSLDQREVGHRGVTEMHVVDTMHERKALISSLSDGFIALPGGYGTFEELCEMVTWTQLGIHDKPVALLDTDGFYQPFIHLLDRAVTDGFISAENRSLIMAGPDPAHLLATMRTFANPVKATWLSLRQS